METSAWLDRVANVPLRVAVNVSPLQLRREEFADDVMNALAKIEGGASRLEIEVTESTLTTNTARAGSILRRLREAGVTVAIDDFGTGHSSLQVLTRLPIDVLKIDRSFIRDLATNRRHRLVVRTTITLAKSLGMKTVAEGVETQEQADILADMGCDGLQGFYVCRPAPAQDINDWIRQRRARFLAQHHSLVT